MKSATTSALIPTTPNSTSVPRFVRRHSPRDQRFEKTCAGPRRLEEERPVVGGRGDVGLEAVPEGLGIRSLDEAHEVVVRSRARRVEHLEPEPLGERLGARDLVVAERLRLQQHGRGRERLAALLLPAHDDEVPPRVADAALGQHDAAEREDPQQLVRRRLVPARQAEDAARGEPREVVPKGLPRVEVVLGERERARPPSPPRCRPSCRARGRSSPRIGAGSCGLRRRPAARPAARRAGRRSCGRARSTSRRGRPAG